MEKGIRFELASEIHNTELEVLVRYQFQLYWSWAFHLFRWQAAILGIPEEVSMRQICAFDFESSGAPERGDAVRFTERLIRPDLFVKRFRL